MRNDQKFGFCAFFPHYSQMIYYVRKNFRQLLVSTTFWQYMWSLVKNSETGRGITISYGDTQTNFGSFL